VNSESLENHHRFIFPKELLPNFSDVRRVCLSIALDLCGYSDRSCSSNGVLHLFSSHFRSSAVRLPWSCFRLASVSRDEKPLILVHNDGSCWTQRRNGGHFVPQERTGVAQVKYIMWC